MPKVVVQGVAAVAVVGAIGSAVGSWGLGFVLSIVVMLFAAAALADRS